MAKSRSHFYVDTPLVRDPPSQRHSMYVSHSEVGHPPTQDLSSASSSATLPSTAGSVDRLTGLGEKKSHRFFTLKPKSSFSLRPFFSSSNISSPSTSKKHRRKSIEAIQSRRDSYVQTDGDDRAYDEVGVQTLNASTVDVPVQTCFREWEEDDRYSYYRRPFAAGAHRPGFYRRPSAGYSSNSPPTTVLKPAKSEPEYPTDSKNSVVAPLVSSKLLKYAAPNDSPAALFENPSSTQGDVNIAVSAKLQETPVASVPQPTVKYFSAKELTSSAVISPLDTSKTHLKVLLPELGDDSPIKGSNSKEPDEVNSELKSSSSSITARSEDNSKRSETAEVNASLKSPVNSLPPVSECNASGPSEVSSGICVISHCIDRPPSALKVERSDSPVKHSAKIKTVHFDLSDSDSPKSSPKFKNKPFDPRNLDKDFEALLRDLDILTDDPNDLSDNSTNNKLTISFNSSPECRPKQTLLSSKLRSAFDILHDDVLPPILEHSNETSEVEPQAPENINNETLINKHETSKEIDPKNNVPISNLVTSVVDNLSEDRCPTPLVQEDENENKLKDCVSPKSTSPAAFTSSKFDLDVGNRSNRENVYDSVIKENTTESVPLPTLPSFFDSSSKFSKTSAGVGVAEDLAQPFPSVVFPIIPQSASEDMLSRSSSRSSVRSNPRSDFNAFHNTKQFDSCENLDQLEEEIIRSLCEPIADSFYKNEISLQSSPVPSEPTKSPDATQMRSAILDRLLSGEGVNSVVSSRNCSESDESNKNTTIGRHSKKHISILTKVDSINNEILPASQVHPQTDDISSSFGNTSGNNIKLGSGERSEIFHESGGSSNLMYNMKNANELPKNNSVFLFTENYPLVSGVAGHSTADAPMVSIQGKTLSGGNLNSPPLQTSPIQHENSECCAAVEDPRSRVCDFTNCLRPSELQNSSFLNKISSSSTPSRLSPDKSYSQAGAPKAVVINPDNNEAKVTKANGQCDYANCLKPSQVQNSIFTAELSELTANKSFDNYTLRTSSPLTARTNSPVPRKSSILPTVIKKTEDTEKNVQKDEGLDQEVCHKSELTIVLKPHKVHQPSQSPDEGIRDKEETFDDGVIELPPVFSTKKEPQLKYFEQQCHYPGRHSSVHVTLPESVGTQSATSDFSQIPPPPPPPPPPMTKTMDKNLNNNGKSFESMIQVAQSNMKKTEPSSDPKVSPPKTPVMIELEKRFETYRRGSSEEQDQETPHRNVSVKPELVDRSDLVKQTENNGGNYFINQTSPNATTYRCNGSNGFSSEAKEHNSSLLNGKSENSNGKEHSFSSKTIVTDAPPPPGAVLLDKKVIVDGDKVHTDKYYAIPVKEVLKETTTTTKFIPAPPKYEGIGPTEDGVPIGLRNSVKKENMHNWYKTMFKSLHKVDSALDGQEYVIGYSSEPETSRKDKSVRKKSATLDNRSGNSTSRATESLYKQNYPPSAKSSIEVYNVRPRLIEDYEPGNSSVTDDEISYGSKRFLPPLNAPKPSYEFKNGYEQENNFIRNLSLSDGPDSEQQKAWYKEIQKGGEIPQFGLGKPAPERPKEPTIGPLPPPPLNYNGPTVCQATRPLNLPANYQTDNGVCQQLNGPYEMQMRQIIHTEMQHRLSPSSSQLSSPSRSVMKSPSRSPDLKLPARALFDFNAESPKEISFKKGDIVMVLRQLDKNWYEGERHGCIGIFPISYVEIVPPEHTSTPIKSVSEGSAKVRYDFTAQTSVELSVRKGDLVNLIRKVDSNWYECRFNSKKGIIPASYLQVLQEPTEKSTLSPPPPKSCLKSPRSSSETNSNSSSPYLNNNTNPPIVESGRAKFQGRSKKGYSLLEPVLYKAMYSYNPQNDDELELLEGDTIYVVEMCDDGWYVGTSVRTGVFGIFPGNYVEKA